MDTLADSDAREDATAFVERFQTFWSSPQTVPLSTLLTPDVRLVQPLTSVIRGLPAAEAWRRRLLTAMPSLRITLEGWSERRGLLFIAFRMQAHEPSFHVEWPAVDRFRLLAGLASERISYFDSRVLLAQVARQPATWLRFLSWAISEGGATRGAARAQAQGY